MNFPITIVDDFYPDPDKVRQFALDQQYTQSHPGYPGVRTEQLHTIDQPFTDQFCQRLFSLFYDFMAPIEWDLSTSFHLIQPYNNPKANTGLIHKDYKALCAGVVYLNPNPDPTSGTTLCQPNNTHQYKQEEWDSKLFSYDEDYIGNVIPQHTSMFNQTLAIDNVYNRMVLYDGDYWHKISKYTPDRLNQVFFVYQVKSPIPPPIYRMNFV